MSKKILGFSYSRWGCFSKCKRKFKYKFIDRIKEEDNYATSRGGRIDKLAEGVVKGDITGTPKDLKYFKDDFKYLAELYSKGKAEVQKRLLVDLKWNSLDNWPGYWNCGFLDTLVSAESTQLIIDYKTGKIREDDHEEQANMYACLLQSDNLLTHVEFWYLDQADIRYWSYTKDEIKKLQKMWLKRYGVVLKETKYPSNPSYLCDYCSFANSKGGPCEEG